MRTTMLSRLSCCFGSRRVINIENAENASPPPLPGTRPDSSTTTSSTPPNEKSSIKGIQLDDTALLVDTHAISNPAMTETPISPPQTNINTLILDLGDVLFHYAVREITAVSPSTFKAMIKSPAWAALECGLVNEDEAVQRISTDLSIPLTTIREALSQCRSLLHVDHDLFARLVALKREHGNLTVVAMTNISKDDFARLKVLCPRWDELFDGEFTSFGAGRIKPDLGYYQHVIDSVGLVDPNEAVFVDDKLVNVDAARSFGIHGIVFESPDVLVQQLRSQLMGSGLPLGAV